MGERYWEVDAIRGIALIGMIVYHLLACMVIFHMIVEDAEFLTYYGTINIASASFVLIAGVALILRHARKKGEQPKSTTVPSSSKRCFCSLLQ